MRFYKGQKAWNKGLGHGENRVNSRIYRIWDSMRMRCSYKKDVYKYSLYGGRGIKVCEQWNDYLIFKHWALTSGYNDILTLDRIDNDLGYNPKNCQWIPSSDQPRNQRRLKLNFQKANEIRNLYKTGGFTQRDLAKLFNVTQGMIGYVTRNKSWFK